MVCDGSEVLQCLLGQRGIQLTNLFLIPDLLAPPPPARTTLSSSVNAMLYTVNPGPRSKPVSLGPGGLAEVGAGAGADLGT